MLAVLPKRSQDELSGELFIAAYQRKLGHLSNDAISHIADKAMEKCHWFPTIAECLEFMDNYWRNDADTALRARLRDIEAKESRARTLDDLARQRKAITQDDVNSLDGTLQRIGVAKGWLVPGPDGKLMLNPDDDCKGIQF